MAQTTRTRWQLNGKILQMTPTGGVPSGNRFNSLVYTCSNPAFRNPILVWTPAESSPNSAAIANWHLFAAAPRGNAFGSSR